MLDFTIIMNGDMNQVELEPFSEMPDLRLMLLPSARIGRDDNNVHLVPAAIHNFFNAMLFSQWLATANSLSVEDAFSVFLIHDMFKPLLHFVPKPNNPSKRDWWHAENDRFFKPIESKLQHAGVFSDFLKAFDIANHHMQPKQHGIQWKETNWHEQNMDFKGDVETVGMSIALEPALSNVFGLEYVKSLFVEAYTEALRNEYPSVFAKLGEITYRYEFADTQPLSRDPKKIEADITLLSQHSNVTLKDKRLLIESFIGAYSPVAPDQHSRVRLPSWLLLVLHQDPTSIIFPIPVTATGTTNQSFVDRVRAVFKTKLESVFPSNLAKAKAAKSWSKKRETVLKGIDQHTFRILNGSFETVQGARKPLGSERCTLCGSTIHNDFVCSPVKDLGFGEGNYTDWHNHGDLDHCCALCAVSNFEIPPAFVQARKLVGQRQLVYLATSTPGIVRTKNHLERVQQQTDVLPFFTAAPINPILMPSSLESLVTLNVVAALFLESVKRLAGHRGLRGKGKKQKVDTRLLWLEESAQISPFTFIGKIGRDASEITASFNLLKRLLPLLSRSIWLLDPIISAEIEVPFRALISLAGVKNEKHFELKFKPMVVSNLSGNLPVIRNGFHFVDKETLEAMEEIQSLTRKFRPTDPIAKKRWKDSWIVTAVRVGDEEFLQLMTGLGGFSVERINKALEELSHGGEPYAYLKQLRDQMSRYPIILEQWSK